MRHPGDDVWRNAAYAMATREPLCWIFRVLRNANPTFAPMVERTLLRTINQAGPMSEVGHVSSPSLSGADASHGRSIEECIHIHLYQPKTYGSNGSRKKKSKVFQGSSVGRLYPGIRTHSTMYAPSSYPLLPSSSSKASSCDVACPPGPERVVCVCVCDF